MEFVRKTLNVKLMEIVKKDSNAIEVYVLINVME